MSTLKQLHATRQITSKQYKTAILYHKPRLSTFDGNLWVTDTATKRRLLINRRGQIAFDGVQLTGK